MAQNLIQSAAHRLRMAMSGRPAASISPVASAPAQAGPAASSVSVPPQAIAVTPRRTPLVSFNPDLASAPTGNLMESIRRRTQGLKAQVQAHAPSQGATLISVPSSVKEAVPEIQSQPATAVPAPAAPVTSLERWRAAAATAASATTMDLPEVGDFVDGDDRDDGESSTIPSSHTLAGVVVPVSAPTPTPTPEKRLSAIERMRAASAAAPALDLPSIGSFDGGDDREAGESSNPEAAHEEIVGLLSSVKEFNGWGVGIIYTEERQEVRVTGASLIGLHEGLEYAFKGRPTNHATYGEGYEIVSAIPVIAANDEAIERFLTKSFKGIGPVKAKKFLEKTRAEGGDEAVAALRQTLLNEPWNLDLTAIDEKARFADGEDSQEAAKLLMVTRNLMLRLGSKPGFKEKTSKALAAYLLNTVTHQQVLKGKKDEPFDVVGATWAALMLNPYGPIRNTEGYGFGMAELVASVAGIPRDSALRLGALVEYAVEDGCQRKGHTFLRPGDFVEAIRKIDPTAQAQQALTFAIEQKLVVIDKNRVYTERLNESEKSLAMGLAKLMQPATALTKRSAEAVGRKLNANPEEISPAFANGFDEDQVTAVASLMTAPQRLHVLTGGPGTGKTAIMEVLLTLLGHKRFAFCTPTGKAAKVLSAVVKRFGYTAVTINSLLKGAEEGGFKVNAEEPLDLDVLVVDEGTMNGIGNAAAILAAMPADAHLIVVGDPGLPEKEGEPDSAVAGQLPSISPGRFMADLLLLPGINHAHLTKTYRNSGGILEVVKEVASGKLQTTDRPAVTFSHGLPEPEVGFPAVMQEYLEKVAKDGVENTMLVMPKRQGNRDTPGWNTTFANFVLRQTCNPHGERLPGSTMYLGDRVLIRENMEIPQPSSSDKGETRRMQKPDDGTPFKLDFSKLRKDWEEGKDSEFLDSLNDDGEDRKERVVNGDTGTIIAYSMASNQRRMGSPKWIRIALDDGREVEYPGADMASLDHAYALTVHSTQGSQYKNVMMVVTPGGADFMNQTMINTGFSRASNDLSIHGEDHVIKRIASTPMPARNSGLVDRVKTALSELEASVDDPADDAGATSSRQMVAA